MAKDILTQSRFLYGQLNPVQRKKNVNAFDPNADPLHYIRDRIRKDFAASAVDGVMRFKAVVLRVYEDDSDEASWWDNVSSWFSDDDEVNSPKVKAMIPEIHGSILPTPTTLGTTGGKGIIPDADNVIIDLYPTFAYKASGFNAEMTNQEVAAIKPGSLVWVTFGNLENLTDPILLGPARDNTSIAAPPSNTRPPQEDCLKALMPKDGFISCDKELEIRKFPDFEGTVAIGAPSRMQLPKGKGIFVQGFPDIGVHKLEESANQAEWRGTAASGVDWICVLAKKPQRPGLGVSVSTEKTALKNFVEAYQKKDIQVFLYAEPLLSKGDIWISDMFALAKISGCNGVIASIKKDFLLSSSPTSVNWETIYTNTHAFSNRCRAAAVEAGCTFGITSYGNPREEASDEFAEMLSKFVIKGLGGEKTVFPNFVLPRTFMDAPNADRATVLDGLREYINMGMINRIPFTSFGDVTSQSYRVLYPKYDSDLKPPEEVFKRTSWLLGTDAVDLDVFDYKDAIAFWSWEIINKRAQPSTWVINYKGAFADFAKEIETYINKSVFTEADDTGYDPVSGPTDTETNIWAEDQLAVCNKAEFLKAINNEESKTMTDAEYTALVSSLEAQRNRIIDLFSKDVPPPDDMSTTWSEHENIPNLEAFLADLNTTSSDASSDAPGTPSDAPDIKTEVALRIEFLKEEFKSAEKHLKEDHENYTNANMRRRLGLAPGADCPPGTRRGTPQAPWASRNDYRGKVWKAPYCRMTAEDFLSIGTTLENAGPLLMFAMNRVRAYVYPPQLLSILADNGSLAGGPKMQSWGTADKSQPLHVLAVKRLKLMNKAWLHGDPSRIIPPPPEPGERKPMGCGSGKRTPFWKSRAWLLKPGRVLAQLQRKGNFKGKSEDHIKANSTLYRNVLNEIFPMRDGKIFLEGLWAQLRGQGEGTRGVAQYSPHETGLACDFYLSSNLYNDTQLTSVGIAVTNASTFISTRDFAGNHAAQVEELLKDKPDGNPQTITSGIPIEGVAWLKQYKTEWHFWMILHAHKFGFTPLGGTSEPEAWHWECLLPRDAWWSNDDDEYYPTIQPASGAAPYRNYSVKWIEKSASKPRWITTSSQGRLREQAGKVGFK